MPLGGMYILLLIDRIFCVYLLSLFSPIQFKYYVSILIFCLGDLSIVEGGVLKSCYYIAFCFSFQICSHLLFILRCFDIGCIFFK